MMRSTVGKGGMAPGTGTVAGTPAHKGSILGAIAAVFMLCGTILWLIGSALFVGSQKRSNLVLTPARPFPIVNTFAIFSGGLWTAAFVLWIIGSIFWLIGSFIHLFASLGQALAVAVNGVRPSPAKWLIFGAVMQLIGTLLILIGSCVVGGSTLSSVSAGAILMFIGFSMWALNVLIALGVNWTVASMAAAFPLPRQRQYAWSAFTSTMFLLVQTLLYVVGSVALIVRDPAGLWLAAGLYFLVGSIYGTWGWMGQMRGGFGYYTPVMGLMNAGLVGTGAGVGAGVATGAATGAVAGAGTAAAVHHHEQQHAGMGMGAAPGATGMGAGPGMMKSGSGLGSGVGSGVGPGMAGAGPGTATTATAAPAARVV